MPSPMHGVTTANVVSTVALGVDVGAVEILKRDTAGELFISVDGSDPTVGGNGFEILPEGVSSISLPSLTRGDTIVKLISSSAVRFSVKGL